MEEQMKQRYRILKKLAEGGNGIVYLIWDIHLKKKWIMKEIKIGAEEWKLREAKQEIEILKKVRREGIPMLIDAFCENGRMYLIMEYMEGWTLEEYIQRKGILTEEDALLIFRQLLELTGYLHSLLPVIVHGDLKPGNIILADNKVSLIDFGTSGIANASCKEGLSLTPGYTAPEVFDTGLKTRQSDIYALGAILLYMITGDNKDLRFPSAPRQNLLCSEKTEEIIVSCMEKEPEKRFRTIQEVRTALETETKKDKGRHIFRRKKKLFRCVKNCMLTDYKGKTSVLMGGLLCLICLTAIQGAGIRNKKELLPVSIRKKDGEKVLVDYHAEYHTKEAPMFELSKDCLQKGKSYQVTLLLTEKNGGEKKERSFVICAD